MKHTFVIRNDLIRHNAIDVLKLVPAQPLHDVIIKPHNADRSVSQNSLYWLWLTLIAGECGETKDDKHDHYKGMFLVHIYERDDKDYAAMIEAVRKVYRSGMKEDARFLRDQIVKLTSTTTASVDQFTEYLNDIEQDALKLNIVLPHPEDRYYEAMGIKR